MGELSDLLRRTEAENILSYLMQKTEPDTNITNDYDQILEEAFQTISSELKEMCPVSDDGRLSALISDFSEIHDSLFFQTGLLAGFRLCKRMEKTARNFSDEYIQKTTDKVLEKYKLEDEGQPSIWDALFESRSDSVLKDMIKEDEEYKKSLEDMEEKEKKLEKSNLSQDQWIAVDQVLSTYNNGGIAYGKIAYRLGLKDGASFLMKLIKTDSN